MRTFPPVAPRPAEYRLLQVAVPGGPVVNAGVFLSEAGRIEFKPRMGLADLAPGLEPEEREALSGLGDQVALELREEGQACLDRLFQSLSNVIRITEARAVAVRDFRYQLDRLFDEHVLGVVREPAPVIPFERRLPVYSLRAAAGKFGEDMEVEPEGWVDAPGNLHAEPGMFVAHVTGHSMEPAIPDGSLAVFRYGPAGSRQGKRVLVWRRGAAGNEFTLKVYRSEKTYDGEGSWEHNRITLMPLNPEYEPLELDSEAEYQVLGEFVCVLKAP